MHKVYSLVCKFFIAWLFLTGFSQQSFSQAGTHLRFDGTNDYVSSPTLSLANTSFTIEFWAQRQAGFGAYQYIFSQGTASTANDFVGVLFRLNNRLSFSFWADDLDAATAISENKFWVVSSGF